MFAQKAFFSVMGVTDPSQHRAYNEYHQLDHRPENLVMPGVAWGDRWVRSPDCASASTGSDRSFDDCHYTTMYWLREPLDASLKAWTELGERAYLWGRRPDLAWRKNHLQAFVDPVKGYAAPRILISSDALPFRPVRGVHMTISKMLAHDDHATHDAMTWYDRVRFPDLLDTSGVAGLWTFVSEDLLAPGRDTTNSYTARSWTRITLLYLDEDPLSVLTDMQGRDASLRRAGRLRDLSNVEDIRFATPMRAIVPWQWDWFDGAAA